MIRSRLSLIFAVTVLAFLNTFGCSLPQENNSQEPVGPNQEIKDLKAEVYAVPGSVSEALPGLLNDNIYIYREISPSVNLVAYEDDYSLERAVQMAARAFLGLLDDGRFTKDIDFWIIQIQPKQGPEVLVWGVRPQEAKRYKESGSLDDFFANSEYVLIDDKIIPKGDQRTALLKRQDTTLQSPSEPGDSPDE